MPEEKKFVGPRVVSMVVVNEGVKTYSGGGTVFVHYEGGEKELMTKRTYEIVSTPEASDHTSVRNKKFEAINKELYPIISTYILTVVGDAEQKKEGRTQFLQDSLSLISEFDIKVSEIDSFLTPLIAEMTGAANAIACELDNTINRATNFLWTKNDSNFIPGADSMMDRTFLEAKKVNSEIPSNEPTKATTE